jgi:hypothetical protein
MCIKWPHFRGCVGIYWQPFLHRPSKSLSSFCIRVWSCFFGRLRYPSATVKDRIWANLNSVSSRFSFSHQYPDSRSTRFVCRWTRFLNTEQSLTTPSISCASCHVWSRQWTTCSRRRGHLTGRLESTKPPTSPSWRCQTIQEKQWHIWKIETSKNHGDGVRPPTTFLLATQNQSRGSFKSIDCFQYRIRHGDVVRLGHWCR